MSVQIGSNLINFHFFQDLKEFLKPGDVLRFATTCRGVAKAYKTRKILDEIQQVLGWSERPSYKAVGEFYQKQLLVIAPMLEPQSKDLNETMQIEEALAVKVELLVRAIKARDSLLLYRGIPEFNTSMAIVPKYSDIASLVKEEENVWEPVQERLPLFGSLYCRKMKFTAFPSQSALMTSVTYLDLSQNDMTTFPTILSMKKLRVFDLSHNALSSLPPDIASLSALVIFDLSCNKLTTVPSEMAQMKNLRHLALAYNPIKDIPHEVLERENLKVVLEPPDEE